MNLIHNPQSVTLKDMFVDLLVQVATIYKVQLSVFLMNWAVTLYVDVIPGKCKQVS